MGILAQIPLIPIETILTDRFPVINSINGFGGVEENRLTITVAATEVR